MNIAGVGEVFLCKTALRSQRTDVVAKVLRSSVVRLSMTAALSRLHRRSLVLYSRKLQSTYLLKQLLKADRSLADSESMSRSGRGNTLGGWVVLVVLGLIVVGSVSSIFNGGGSSNGSVKWHTSCSSNLDGSDQVTVSVDHLSGAGVQISPYVLLDGGEKHHGDAQFVTSTGTYSYDVTVPPAATALGCGADMS